MSNNEPIYVLNKTLALYQAPEGFRTSMDSVMLAAACPAHAGESILDMGCGVGSAGLCAIKRVNGATLTGFDIQSTHIYLAHKNATENNLQAVFTCADVRDDLDIGTFNHVICNPPYLEHGKHLTSPSSAKATAMGHSDERLNLRVWTTKAWNHIKAQGSLTMIHDAGKTDEIIHALYGEQGGKRFGGVEIFPIYSKTGTPAKRVIIRAWKHKQSPVIIHSGIIMHDDNGTHTKEADDILRHAASLF